MTYMNAVPPYHARAALAACVVLGAKGTATAAAARYGVSTKTVYRLTRAERKAPGVLVLVARGELTPFAAAQFANLPRPVRERAMRSKAPGPAARRLAKERFDHKQLTPREGR